MNRVGSCSDRLLVPFNHASDELVLELFQHRAATVLLDLGDNHARISPTTAR